MREALLRLLDEGIPFKDLTVDELARAAGLSRTAFYFYFPGKSQVLMAVADEVAEESYEQSNRWWSGDGPPGGAAPGRDRGQHPRLHAEHALFRTAAEATHYDEEFHAFYKEQVTVS